MVVNERFRPLVDQFFKMHRTPDHGGAGLCVYQRGRLVVDVWRGVAGRASGAPWTGDTMAMSYSTGKGVVSTVIHRLADRGLLNYDEPIATYWPEFAAHGKGEITVADLLTHRAGLHDLRAVVRHADELRDHEHFAGILAAAPAGRFARSRPAYHAVTFGTIAAEVCTRVTGIDFDELTQREVCEPLGLDGIHFTFAADQRAQLATNFPDVGVPVLGWDRAMRIGSRLPPFKGIVAATMVEGLPAFFADPDMHDVLLPAATGKFSARSLARMYAAIANGGELDGVRLLSEERVRLLSSVQTNQRDAVLGYAPRWRLGYHSALPGKVRRRNAFGHFGTGGSAAFAETTSGLAFAYVRNRMGGALPLMDLKAFRLARRALRLA